MSWPIIAATVSLLPLQVAALPVEVLGSPVGDYLRDPLSVFRNALAYLRDLATIWGPIVGPIFALAVTAAAIARRKWRRYYHDKLATDARLITVLAPPTVDPSGAITVWSNLVGLLRPGWLRRFSGQPHLGFELTFNADGVQIQIWVPGLVPPGMVERAIEAAWPGAHTRTTPAKPPIPLSVTAGRQVVAIGGESRPASATPLPPPFPPTRPQARSRPHEKYCGVADMRSPPRSPPTPSTITTADSGSASPSRRWRNAA